MLSLKKRTADQYVGRIGFTGTVHKLVPGWSYATGTHTLCGIKWFAVFHCGSGRQINITCKRCLASIRKGL